MLNPATALAIAQDKILNRHNYTPDEARAHLNHLSQFEVFLSTQPNSNLKVRQAIICTGLVRLIGTLSARDGYDYSVHLYQQLMRGGEWLEGPDYHTYTMSAFVWYSKVTGTPMDETILRHHIEYRMLVAPDGTIPVPEARNTEYPVEIWSPNYVSLPRWIIKRWPSGAYLLVGIDPETEPRANLHYHVNAGYFAFGRMERQPTPVVSKRYQEWVNTDPKFVWAVRCPVYDGWDLNEVWDENGLLDLLPPGAMTPVLWRVKPPHITVKRLPNGVRVRWHKPWFDVVREVTWSATGVRCTDKWGGWKRKVREWAV
jgi:hypothetical protein